MTGPDKSLVDEAAFVATQLPCRASDVLVIRTAHESTYVLSGDDAGPRGTDEKAEITYEREGRCWRLVLEEVPF